MAPAENTTTPPATTLEQDRWQLAIRSSIPADDISAYGQTGAGRKLALVLINYGINDLIHRDARPRVDALSPASIKALAAVRASAPGAQIIILIPFDQYFAKELKEAVERRKAAQPADHKIAVIDLGPGVAKNLAAKNGVFGGLHPNDRGCANFAAQIIPQVFDLLRQSAL